MSTERRRTVFANFIREQKIENFLKLDSCITIDQDTTLKYERIDKYKVLLLTFKELKKLLSFCGRHDICVWFAADKLCIGFNYTGCQRLSAYDSVHVRQLGPDILEDRKYVPPEITAASSLGDRIGVRA